MTSITDLGQFSDFDFESVSPSEEQAREVFSEIAELDSVTDFLLSLTLCECKLHFDSEVSDFDSVYSQLPSEFDVQHIYYDDETDEFVARVEFIDWFQTEPESSPKKETQQMHLDEKAAFVQASMRQVSVVESATVVSTNDEVCAVEVSFESNSDTTTTAVLGHIKDWLQFSYVDFTTSKKTFDTVTVEVPPMQLSISELDGFRFTKIVQHEKQSIHTDVAARLPCGHSSEIKSYILKQPEEIEAVAENITLDGCEFSFIDSVSISNGFLSLIGVSSSSGSIPVTVCDGMVCMECNSAYLFNDFDEFKNTVCSPVSWDTVEGVGAEKDTYNFIFPAVDFISDEFMDSYDVSIDSDSFDWLFTRP